LASLWVRPSCTPQPHRDPRTTAGALPPGTTPEKPSPARGR
jgi:hypothetical protein